MNKGIGQYDTEYLKSTCFWGTQPGKFVKEIPKYLKGGKVLDIGAGEGKNSIYLASLGFNIVAVEVSEFAVNNFAKLLERQDDAIKRRITIKCEDARKFCSDEKFDAVIAYGLLHCMPTIQEWDNMVNVIQDCTINNGYNIIVTFNNEIGVPSVQDYLEPTLVDPKYLAEKYAKWKIIKYENGIIEESHPTSKVLHKHSLTRLIAKMENGR